MDCMDPYKSYKKFRVFCGLLDQVWDEIFKGRMYVH